MMFREYTQWIWLKQTRQLSVVALLCLLTAACSMNHTAISDPEFSAVRPISARPLPILDGSIYRAGFNVALFEDIKARRIGDIITIILQESTNSSKTADTTTLRENAIEIAAPTIFGQGVNRKGAPILSANIDASSEFTAEAESIQSNSLSGQISVTIVEVLANGNLIIRGEKLLTLNQGSEHVRISGIIRASDITPRNTVLSGQVANANIIYAGQGALAETNEKGWFARVLDSGWWPF
jgi:flagellar L-ring protein FlgH